MTAGKKKKKKKEKKTTTKKRILIQNLGGQFERRSKLGYTSGIESLWTLAIRIFKAPTE